MSIRILITAVFAVACYTTTIGAQLTESYDSFNGIGGYSQPAAGQGYYQDQGYDSWSGGDRYNQGYDQGYGCGPDCGCNECGEERRVLQRIHDRRNMNSGRLCDRLSNRQRFRDRDFRDSYFDQAGDFDQSCYDTGGSCQRGPFYISGFGGFASIDNFSRSNNVEDGPRFATIDRIGAEVVDGGGVGVSVGRYVHPRGRAEFEFTYRDAGVEEVFENRTSRDLDTAGADEVIISQSFQDAGGNLNVVTGIYNVVFDFKKRQVGCAHLYAGGGIGAIFVDGSFSTTGATPTDFDVDSSGFAFQGLVGVAYPMRSGLDLFTEYRYTGSQNIAVDDVTNDVPLGAFRLDSHNVFLGLRLYR